MAIHHIVVIGAGSTGAAIAHDLALRGLRVTLIQRFGPAGVEPASAIMNLRKELMVSVIKRKGK
ncbi:MAG TPA: FAD-dependent oxidoreductase [Anaerolineales bacterium]